MRDPILFYDAANFVLTIGSLSEGIFSSTWTSTMTGDSLGSFVHVVGSPDRTLLYNPFSGQTRIFRLGSGAPTLLADYPPGGTVSRFWTHVLPVGDLIFFYAAASGAAAIADISSGALVTRQSFGDGSFSAGWTHLAAMGNTLLFYDTIRGAGALGVVDGGGFRTLQNYEPGSFSSDWTHIVSSGDRFLFYDIRNGRGAIAAVEGSNLVTVDNIEPGQFSTGWTHIMGNADGVLFYNASDGSAVGGRIVPGGFASLKMYSAGSFSSNWTHIVSRSSSRVGMLWRAIQGFAWPVSVRPGETVQFFVSTGAPTYETTCVGFRNASGALPITAIDQNEELIDLPLGEPQTITGRYQHTDFSPTEGCGRWDLSFEFPVPDNWISGIYAMKCVAADGDVHYIPFVVNPPGGRSAKLALIVNTNTWAMYNSWGGYSRYSLSGTGPVNFSVKRPHFSLLGKNTYSDQYTSRHLLRGELWFFNWLRENQYEVDLWTDLDFHDGLDRLQEYAALIISTHPEYWSVEMMNRLKGYLNAGGRLINLGANGLYDAVEVSDDFSSLTVYGTYGEGRSNLFRQIGQPESAVLGIAFPWIGDDVGNCPTCRVPYIAQSVSHPFMAGITEGESFGNEGWSYDAGHDTTAGCAAGWEGDVIDQWSPPLEHIVSVDGIKFHRPFLYRLASASVWRPNGPGFDLYMVTYNHSGGGWVFSVGSMAFTGSVPVDGKVQMILRNVLSAALNS